MNVLIVTNWYPTKKNPVAGVFVKEFAEAVSNYCKVTVFHPEACKDVKFYEVTRENAGSFEVVKLRYRKTKLSTLSYLIGSVLSILWLLRNYRSLSPDIIHAHNYLAAIWALFVGKAIGVPVIITEHGFHKEGDDYKKYMLEPLRNYFKYISAKIVFNFADMLIFVSRASRDHISQKFNVTTANRVVPNVLNRKFMDVMLWKNENKNKKNKKKILFIGGLYPRKGVEYLLEAIKIVAQERTDFIVEIIGYGPYGQQYETLASKLGLRNFVSFLGRVSDEEKIEALKNCDFLVLPSLFENFGIVLIEAMACGKPVVTTSSGGQVEFVNKNNGLLVQPKDANALARAIKYMLDNSTKYSPKEISNYVKKRFNYNTVGKTLQQAYLDLIMRKTKSFIRC